MPEIANGSVFSQTDGSNTGALPGLTGSSSPALIDNSIQALMGAIKREHDWRNFTVTSGGSANAYTLTYSVAPAAYYTGQAFGFITNFAVTGSATVNVNALGAKTIKKLVAGVKTNLASGDISSGDFVQIVYDGTDMVWVNKGQTYTLPANVAVKDADNSFSANQTGVGFNISKAAGNSRNLLYYSGSSLRWAVGTTADAESGANAGSKFYINRSDDSGNYLGTSMIIDRATGLATFEKLAGDGSALTSLPNPVTTIRKATVDNRASTTLTSDTDFTFSMLANTNYRIRGTLYITLSGTTPGVKIGVTGPASPTSVLLTSIIFGGSGLTFSGVPAATGATATVTHTQTGTSADIVLTFEVVWRNGANAGTFAIQHARQSGTGNFNVNTDSMMTYERFT